MTAFIVAPYRDRVEILSDGALYSPDGVLLGFANKVIYSDALPLAVVGSGATKDIAALTQAIFLAAVETGSVDAALEILAGALSEIGGSPNFDTGLRMAIGAISETDGPVAYTFATFNEPGGTGAFELRRMPRTFAQGCAPTGADFAAYGALSIESGLEKDALFMIDAMRRQKMTNPAEPLREPFYSVGGHIDLTVIRAEGITTKRLHVFSADVVGRPIDPFAVTHDDGTTFSDGSTYA